MPSGPIVVRAQHGIEIYDVEHSVGHTIATMLLQNAWRSIWRYVTFCSAVRASLFLSNSSNELTMLCMGSITSYRWVRVPLI
jgi:hypothetical protein